jgi:UDPglucose 6-dehydrogenase
VFDPQAMDNSRALFPTLNYATSAFEACAGADAVLVLTEWAEFRSIDPVALKETVRSACVIDGRNCLDASAWSAAGWRYRALGRPALGRDLGALAGAT